MRRFCVCAPNLTTCRHSHRYDIPEVELQLAWESTPEPVRQALKAAARNIRAFAARQRPKDFDVKPAPGVTTGQRVIPLASVGCYVPVAATRCLPRCS